MASNGDRRSPLEDNADRELVVKLRDEGNVMAFQAIFNRYKRPIFGFLLRQTGDRGRAEDLFQETFLRVYHRIDTCKNPDALRTWTFAIAANLCRNEIRRQREQPGAQPDNRANPGANPEGAAIASETWRKIRRALMDLPAAQREVFILYQFTRLSYEEIAETLQEPLGTVKSRMNAAVARLRELLGELRKGDQS